MMLVLDTDHVVEYQKGASAQARSLRDRPAETSQPYATTVITVEEMMRGWMAALRRITSPRLQVDAYSRLRKLFHFFAVWRVLDWDHAAVDEFENMRHGKIRVGTMDLKIASIVLAQNATLLTRNQADFRKIPGLVVEDWLA